MEQNIGQAIQQNKDFENAKQFLKEKGEIKNIDLPDGRYRVEIEIEDIVYFEVSDDLKIATIRLKNQV